MKKDEIILMSVFAGIGTVFAIIGVLVESIVAKWIWWILAIAVFGFTLYATIDAIVKNKRKPKDIFDLMKKMLEEEEKKPDFEENLKKNIEESAKRRDILFEGQKTDADDYGYSLENPIMTSSVFRSDAYLESLRNLRGEKFTWERLGSYCMPEISGVENVMVDEYQLFVNNEKYAVIYICPYGHSSSHTPKGMVLSSQ